MDKLAITVEEFVDAIKAFKEVSDKINDGWKMYQNSIEIHKTYIKKEAFITCELNDVSTLCKIEYIIYYNLSYGVPSFSFNIWNSYGALLKLDEICKVFSININQDEFYSIITQQEHPLFGKPYYIMHPCHTGQLLSQLKDKSKNIIVSFLGLITPLIKLNLPLEYGL